jgi:CBS domain-containing protein
MDVLMAITISEMMSKSLETIQETASIQEAAKRMKEKGYQLVSCC